MHPVFIRSAALGAPFTDKPRQGLREQMFAAGAQAIASAGLSPPEVDALYVAAMGSFTPERFLGALPLWLAGQLELHEAEIAPMLSGSSETGAWALRSAFEAARRDDHLRNVLVIAGEQMNPLAHERPTTQRARAEERRQRNDTIAQVVDEIDRRYGLNMLRISDLLMDGLAHRHDLDREDLVGLILPFVALEKYRRVRRYPYGQFASARLRWTDEYHARPRLTPYFRLDDVTPTTTGAVAVVLSNDRRPGLPAVQLRGMGQGFVPASLVRRRGDVGASSAIRGAYSNGCKDAGVEGVGWLRACDFAIIHDAFPAIEYFFLKELGLYPEEVITRMISGWSNPLGGLKACGHALGASGLLQVAKSFQVFTHDMRYLSEAAPESPIPEAAPQPPLQRCFTTSVGGALTNVLVTLLERLAPDAPPLSPLPVDAAHLVTLAARGEDAATTLTSPSAELAPPPTPPVLPPELPEPRPGEGYVLARTQLTYTPVFGDDRQALFAVAREPWIYLVAVVPDARGGLDKALAYADEPVATGSRVRLQRITLADGERYHRVTGVLSTHAIRTRVTDAARVAFLIDLERRLQAHVRAPLSFLDPPVEPLPGVRCYARLERRDGVERFRGRLTQPRSRLPIGAPVLLLGLEPDDDRVARWLRRAQVASPALLGVHEVNAEASRPFVLARHREGAPLVAGLARQAPALPTLLAWYRALLEALVALHAHDLAHGDARAERVIVSPTGAPLLLEPWCGQPERDSAHAPAPLDDASRAADHAGAAELLEVLLSAARPPADDQDAAATLAALTAWGARLRPQAEAPFADLAAALAALPSA